MREKAMMDSLKKVRKAPKITYINHLGIFLEDTAITEEIMEKEQELSELLFTN